MRINQFRVLIIVVTLSATISAGLESYPIPPCSTVSFNLPIGHQTGFNARLDNPNIYYVIAYTDNQRAQITIKIFEDPQDANPETMEGTVRRALIDFGVDTNTIQISEGILDRCYCIHGKGEDPWQNTWNASFYWLDAQSRPDSRSRSGLISCQIISNYPENILEDFLKDLHIEC